MGRIKHGLSLSLTFLLIIVLSSCHFDTGETPLLPLEYNTFNELYAGEGSQEQVYTKNADNNIIITGDKGTLIKIPAQSLVNSSGTVVSGDVTIKLKEVITKGEMLISNKPSTSDGSVLEAGGMFYLEVSKNGETLFPNAEYEIFSEVRNAVSEPENMRVFYGDEMESGEVNWMEGPDSITPLSIDSLVTGDNEKVPAFHGVADRFGWVGNGYFYKTNEAMTTLTVNPIGYEGFLSDVVCFLVFKATNTVVRMDRINETINLEKSDLPLGEEIEVVLMATNDDYYYLDTEEITIEDNMTIELDLVRNSFDDLIEDLIEYE